MSGRVPESVARGEAAVFALSDADGRNVSCVIYWAPTMHEAIEKGVLASHRIRGDGLRQALDPDDPCDCDNVTCKWRLP
jgi:hypothetical protein